MSDDDRETLTAYLDGELDEAAEQTLEARLSQDPGLRAEFHAMKQAWEMLDYLPRASASTDFTNRTLDRLSLEGRSSPSARLEVRWPIRRVVGFAAATLAAVLVGVAAAAGYRLYIEKPAGPDEPVVRNLRLLERMPAYETVDDLEFLKALDQPDLFGDEGR